MKLIATIQIPVETLHCLRRGADEHGYVTTEFAAICIGAAAALWRADPRAGACSAFDLRTTPKGPPVAPITLSLGHQVVATIGAAAAAHGMTLDRALRLALDASVFGYDPDEPIVRSPPPGPVGKPLPALPKRAPFDPAKHARSRALDAILTADAAAPRGPARVTAAVMGDPVRAASAAAPKQPTPAPLRDKELFPDPEAEAAERAWRRRELERLARRRTGHVAAPEGAHRYG